jgi:hypothetical protein
MTNKRTSNGNGNGKSNSNGNGNGNGNGNSRFLLNDKQRTVVGLWACRPVSFFLVFDER